jgi:NAD+ kinase
MRVAVLVKRTSYGTFVEEGGDARVGRLLASGDATVSRMRRSHEDHIETEREVREAIDALGLEAVYYRGSRAPMQGHFDLVVTVGGDGTVLGASHQIGDRGALLGVNSAPGSSVGFFCAATKGSVRATLAAAVAGKLAGITLTRMRVEVNGQVLHNRVLNEALFCHASPAATSRYLLTLTRSEKTPPKTEEQKSSGLWIGPAAGSTAAQRSAGGRVLPLTSTKIQYVVREPYIGGITGGGFSPRLVMGLIDGSGRLELASKMRQAKLFLDGNQGEHEIGMGDRIVMRRSDETLTILGLARNGQKQARPRT